MFAQCLTFLKICKHAVICHCLYNNTLIDRNHDVLFLLQLSDWDRFAAEEYELLVAEESSNEQHEEM